MKLIIPPLKQPLDPFVRQITTEGSTVRMEWGLGVGASQYTFSLVLGTNEADMIYGAFGEALERAKKAKKAGRRTTARPPAPKRKGGAK